MLGEMYEIQVKNGMTWSTLIYCREYLIDELYDFTKKKHGSKYQGYRVKIGCNIKKQD